MNKYKLAIVGIFYDGYYDIWEDFLELFSEKWVECPYPLYIVNNVKELEFEKEYNVKVFHAGEDAEYSRKVQMAIKNIDAEYYLLLLEDFFIEKELSKEVLETTLDYIEKNDLEYYRMQIPDFVIKKKVKKGPQEISVKDEYTLSCQPSIWKKVFLKKCIGSENYNAWIFEGIFAFSKNAHTEEFLRLCRVDYSNPLSIRHGAVQGKMLPTVYRDFQTEGYIFKNKREVLEMSSYKKYLRKQKMKDVIPLSIQRFVKKFYKTNSVLDRYKEEICSNMKKMGIE